MRTLLILLALALATPDARAVVVVYKGTCTCIAPNDINQYGRTPRFYYIVDLNTHESYPIFFFTLDGNKQAKGSFPLSPTYYNAAPGLRGKTIGVFNFVFDAGSISNFATIVLNFRGKAIPLPTSSSTTGIFPKTMSGILRGIAHNNGNPFNDEINFLLNYDSFHTQAANNALKSGATVYSDILAELSAKGFN